MATNTAYAVRPAIAVAACTSAHNAGDLVYEQGYVGVAVETNAAGAPNQLIGPGSEVRLVVPASLAAGAKIYAATTTFTAGQTVQAVGTLTAPVTGLVTPDNHRSVAVTSVLNTTNTNALVGTLVTASAADGASVTAIVKLAAA